MAARSEHPDYQIVEQCGEGGNGVVYKALDRRLNRIVALKFLLANHKAALVRFKHEAEAIAALNHPGIAIIYEAGAWDGEPFLALEYLPGGTLASREQQGGLPLAEILEYAEQLGRGLEFAHRKGILHRDVKPSNCMFSAHGSLKLVDFGLAKSSGGEDTTQSGVAVGTVPYMAPELLQGEPATICSDLYALGAVIYELAAGKPMYARAEAATVAEQVLQGKAVPLQTLRPDLPPGFCAAVARATARHRQDRQPSVAAFLDELRRTATGKYAAIAATETLSLPAIGIVRKRRVFASVTAVALVIAGALGASRYFAGHAREETVVVLPFENLSKDAAIQSFCDGLQETVTSILSSAPQMKGILLIVPSSEVRLSKIHTLEEARTHFQATLVLTGAVHRTAKDVQVSLNLTDAELGRQRDARLISAKLEDSAELQQDLAGALAAMIRVRGLARSRAGGSTSVAAANDLFLQGRGALESQDWDKAISLIEKAVQADPKFPLARAKLGEAYARKYSIMKDPQWLAKADEQISQAEHAGEMPEITVSKALIASLTGKSDVAIALFNKVLEDDPNNAEVGRLLGNTFTSLERFKNAEDSYLQALKLRPGYWPLYESLGDCYSRQNKFNKAEQYLLAGLSLAPKSETLYSNLGANYLRMDRLADAARALEKSIALKPTAPAYSNLGTVRYDERKYDEAAVLMEKASKLVPWNAVNWGNLGDALWQIPSRRAESRVAFQHAATLAEGQLAINASNIKVRKNYSLFLAKLGRHQEAVAQVRWTMAQAPKDPSVAFYAARVFTVCGHTGAALAALQQSLARGSGEEQVAQEPDFNSLRNLPVYRRIMASHAVMTARK